MLSIRMDKQQAGTSFFIFSWTICCLVQTSIAQTPATQILAVGNQVWPSDASISIPRIIFLLNEVVPQEGVIFAFSAYLLNTERVRYQVWRMNGTGGANFRLLSEIPWQPVAPLPSQEDTYLSQNGNMKCIRVAPGDRVGIYFEDNYAPMGYLFDQANPASFYYKLEDSEQEVVADQVVTFSQLIFPYAFSASSYMYTIISNSSFTTTTASSASVLVDCDTSVRIPSRPTPPPSTTVVPVTVPRGAAGVAGKQGIQGATGDRGAAGRNGSAIGATGYTGQKGPIGVAGSGGVIGLIGATGSVGDFGFTGNQGPSGEKGYVGDRGLPGPDGDVGVLPIPPSSRASYPEELRQQQQQSWQKWFRNTSLKTVFYVWLAIISFFAFVILVWSIVLCCLYHALQRNRKKLMVQYKTFFD